MPNLAGGFNLDPGPIYQPIVGNTTSGGACSNGAGEAIYAALASGEFRVYKTTGGWRDLITRDGSVTYLSTITSGSTFLDYPATVSLQRINGTVYANLTGKNTANLTAGQWIYRDTSANADGSGPWVLHGTIPTPYTFTSAQTSHLQGNNIAGGEILVTASGLWVTNLIRFSNFDATRTNNVQGVATSSDGGVTWTKQFEELMLYTGISRPLAWSRNFAQWAGKWYIGGFGSPGPYLYSSPDLITWTAQSSGAANACYPVSTPDRIYRFLRDGSDTSSAFDFATQPPESSPTWTNVISAMGLQPFPLLANVSNESRPMWAAFSGGKVMGISASQAVMPPCRQYPREDGLGASSATRQFPRPRGQQSGFRQTDYY